MKDLPISIQTFEKIRDGNYLYIDKTEYVYELVRTGTYYFLSRPRRFGKSLLLTTLKSFFEGRKDLFEGLYIQKKVKDWKTYPIIHIDYSLIEYRINRATFRASMIKLLEDIAKKYEVALSGTTISDNLVELVKLLYRKYQSKVVILVDEYDKPLVDTLTKPEKFNEYREILRSLYGAMKGLDSYLRFVMLTGVSRFAKVGVFSGMNNLDDISMNSNFANIVGFTQNEIETYFKDWLIKLNKVTVQLSRKELMEYIQYWYNGFSFDGIHKLYNSFSLLSLFRNLDFQNYWFSTATPTFLIDLIKTQKYFPENLENLKVKDLTGNSINLDRLPLIPILFQTGYLTINRIERDGLRKYYILNYPNEEVRYSFITHIASAFLNKSEYQIEPEATALRDAFLEERLNDFTQRLEIFLADIPARLHIPKEAYYHSLVYMMLRLVGMQPILEKETSKGRIDAVLELSDKVYVIEFKFATNKRVKRVKTLARQAMRQIEQNQYYKPYLGKGKKVILFGLGFLDKKLASISKVL